MPSPTPSRKWPKAVPDATWRSVLRKAEYGVTSLADDSSSSSPNQSARLTSARIVRTCEDYARKWRYQDVTLAGLCEASGVSERRVRSAFYECYQMSPTAYLRVAALNAVRRELVEGPRLRNAVSHAATDWGFWHLSRFAAQYRALFGESPGTPSATGRIDPGQPQTELSRRSPPRPPARRAPPSRRLAARWPSSSMSRPAGLGWSSPSPGRPCRA